MRRRIVLAALPLGVLGLAACGPERSGPTAPTAVPPVEDTEPVLVGERAEVVEYTEVRLPLEMTPMIVVDPGWTAVPLQLDGVFLGYREEEARLRFLAVDQDGTVLWTADRPLSCTGYVLTRGADEAPVAVLADVAEPTEDDLALIIYTGGTTGRSKGVLHSHRGLAQNIFSHVIETEIVQSDRLLLCSPLPHSAGLHLQAGRIVIEADLDHPAAARRLRAAIAEVYGHRSEVMVVAPGGIRRGARYVVRVVEAACTTDGIGQG